MAAHEKDDQKGQGNFFSVKYNCIVQEAKSEVPGWEKVTGTIARTGESFTKWIKRYEGGIDGYIDSIEWYSRDYNGTKFMGLHVKVNDGNYKAILDLAFNTRSYDAFTKFAANIDFTQPVILKAFLGRDDKVAFYAKQNGITVPRKHTKDDPNGMPEARQSRTGKLDYTEQQDWLLDQILTVIAPRCAAAAKERGVLPPETDDREFEDEEAGENGKAAASPKSQAAPRSSAPPDDPFGDDFDAIPTGAPPTAQAPPPAASKPKADERDDLLHRMRGLVVGTLISDSTSEAKAFAEALLDAPVNVAPLERINAGLASIEKALEVPTFMEWAKEPWHCSTDNKAASLGYMCAVIGTNGWEKVSELVNVPPPPIKPVKALQTMVANLRSWATTEPPF